MTLDSLNGVTLGSSIAYTSYKAPDGQELLSVGRLQSGADGISPSTNDFVLALDVTNPAAPLLLRCSSTYESCGNAAGSASGNGYAVSTLPDYYLAQAATVSASVTETYNFTLTNFTNYIGTDAPPSNLVTGSVTLTFDPIGTHFDSTTGVTLNSLNGIALGSPISYTSYQTPTGLELLYLGGLQNGADRINDTTDDFVLALDVTSPGSPVLLRCSSPYESCGAADGSVYGSGYSVASLADEYGAQVASVKVPEPASEAIYGIGLVGLAWQRRRRSGSAG